MLLYHVCACCLQRPEEGFGCLELELEMAGVTMWMLGSAYCSPGRPAVLLSIHPALLTDLYAVDGE